MIEQQLERIALALETIARNGGIPSSGSVGSLPATAGPALSPPGVAGLNTPVQAPPAGVNADTIVSLITPHIANPAIKEAFGTAMRGMGINALPDTQPHQFGELYQRFQSVIAQFTGGGAPAPAASASII